MYALAEALRAMGKNRLMTLLSLVVIGLSLFILGLFLLVTGNVFRAIQLAEEKVEIVAYLEEKLSDSDLVRLKGQVARIQGVEEVTYVSREKAMIWLRQELRDDLDLLEAVETNPLPSSLQVKVAPGLRNPNDLAQMAGKIALLRGVEEVDYGKEWVEKLARVAQVLVSADLLLGVIFSLASIFLVSNTIKLVVYARREQIEIMALVGAAHRFIRAPFLIEGFLQGFVAGGIASVCLYGLYRLISLRVSGLLSPSKQLFIGLMAFGAFLGYLGSLFSVKRFLPEPTAK